MSSQALAQMIALAGALLTATGLIRAVRRRPAFARRMVIGLFLAATVAAGNAWAQEWSLPKEVPDLLNPQVVKTYALVGTGTLFGDPDFPVIVLQHRGDGAPARVLVVVDARNGKSSWSLQEDPVIFVLVLNSPTGPTVSFADEGFLGTGQPSGVFGRRENLSSTEASDLLSQGIERSVDRTRL